MLTFLGVAAIGLLIGFLGGLLGKGGSAIATPMLHAMGIPAIIAVASPLPATIPSTLAAGYAYSRERLVDWRVVRWSAGFGVPATVAGALATRWVSGAALVNVTDVILVALGIRILLVTRANAAHERAEAARTDAPHGLADATPPVGSLRTATATHTAATGSPTAATAIELAGVAVVVGIASGLLANSGGFLLAPLYMTVLRLPIKRALASSLAVASVLAIPGTIVHAALGHIDWAIVAVFASTSVPLSFVGARVALRTDPTRLERIYGGALVVLGTGFLALR
jgi:uncharacterized membrane protein YfcA